MNYLGVKSWTERTLNERLNKYITEWFFPNRIRTRTNQSIRWLASYFPFWNQHKWIKRTAYKPFDLPLTFLVQNPRILSFFRYGLFWKTTGIWQWAKKKIHKCRLWMAMMIRSEPILYYTSARTKYWYFYCFFNLSGRRRRCCSGFENKLQNPQQTTRWKKGDAKENIQLGAIYRSSTEATTLWTTNVMILGELSRRRRRRLRAKESVTACCSKFCFPIVVE